MSLTACTFVKVRSNRDIGFLFVEVTNSTLHEDFKADSRPSTTKANAEKHGFGLEIVRKIADSYNGEFLLKVENGTALASVAIPEDKLDEL